MILVTGATGLIGSYITHELVKRNHNVRVLVRSTSDLSPIKELINKIEIIEGDILDITELNTAFLGVETVIHAAALVSFKSQDEEKVIKTNVEGTANMVNLALDHKIAKFVYVSSISAIGNSTSTSVLDEKSKWNPDFKYSQYSISKYQAELEVWRASEEGLNTIIINPSVVLSPNKNKLAQAKIFSHAVKHGAFTINGSLNVVDIRDVVTAVMCLLNSTVTNQRFILNAGKISYTDLITIIRSYHNLQKPKILIPWWFLKLYIRVKLIFSFIFRTTPSDVSLSTLRVIVANNYYSGKKITNTTSLEYNTIRETIKWCCSTFVDKKEGTSSHL